VMNDDEKVKQFLTAQRYMVLAVMLDDGTPWAVPVRIQQWSGNEFEWDSRLDTVHSQALEKRPAMAVTIFEKQEDSQIGLYAKGRGELVEEFKPGFGRYKFTMQEAWINDETFRKRQISL